MKSSPVAIARDLARSAGGQRGLFATVLYDSGVVPEDDARALSTFSSDIDKAVAALDAEYGQQVDIGVPVGNLAGSIVDRLSRFSSPRPAWASATDTSVRAVWQLEEGWVFLAARRHLAAGRRQLLSFVGVSREGNGG